MVRWFKKKFVTPKIEVYKLILKPNGDEVTYGDVIGFFKFRDTIYYRAKGVAGRTLDERSLSFTDNIREEYPDEFKDYNAKEISALLVQPLYLVK